MTQTIPHYDEKSMGFVRAYLLGLGALIEPRELPRHYRSNWRVLHCDGFESRPILFFGGYIPFTHYKMTVQAAPEPRATFRRIVAPDGIA